jgi:hypothetical protein
MNPRNRDLLVFTKKQITNKAELERQIEQLNDLFYLVEASNAACIANEVIDLNRYKIINNMYRVRSILQASHLKPFVFISSKN